MKKLSMFLVVLLVLSLVFTGCSKQEASGKSVVIATMIDAEGNLLGHMIMAMLEEKGIPVTDRINFGTPDILRKALENKEVDLVVDYTGSGQYYYPQNAQDTTIWNDPQKGYEYTARLDKENKNIIWLSPASANNTEMIAVKKEFAAANNLVTMADLAGYINSGNPFKLICSASFAENPMGLIGYEKAYGFSLTDQQLLILSSGNTAEMLKALSEGINGVNASLVYGTDGALDQMNLVVLEDPAQVPPVYLPAPVIRGEVLSMYPQIAELLKPVFDSLTLETLQQLNAQVAYEGKEARMVARAYLKENGFTK